MKKTAVLLYPQFSEYELSVALSIFIQFGIYFGNALNLKFDEKWFIE